MNLTYKTFRYLTRGYTVMTLIAAACILACVAVTDLVFHLTDPYDGVISQPFNTPLTVPTEVTAWFFALVAAIALFVTNFKVMLANGVSRKTYLLASLPAAAAFSLALALINQIVNAIHGIWWPLVLIAENIFRGIGWFSLLLVQVSQYLMVVILGWCIVLAFYRANRPVRWALALSVPVLLSLYWVVNLQTRGALGYAIEDVWRASMRSTPGAAILTMLACAALLYGVVYLLLRRAPLKD